MFLRLTSRLLLVAGVISSAAAVSSSTEKISAASTSTDDEKVATFQKFARKIQEAKFRVNYEARFQFLLESTCGGPYPRINVLCNGTFELLGTSSNSIVCDVPLEEDLGGSLFNGYQCRMTCEDRPACSQVWLSTSVESGPYGTIYFQCEGDDLVDVDAAMQYLESEGISCNYNFLGDGRLFHLAQLGVYCPAIGTFSYDDYFFECDSNDFNAFFTQKYTCLAGSNCGGSPCTRDIDTVTISADHFRFGECIQSLDGSELPEPEQPALVDRAAGTYSAQFQAYWQLDLNPFCIGRFPTISIECTNGEISDVDTFYETTNCNSTSPSTIECTELDQDTFVDNYSSVTFVSIKSF